MLQIAMRAAREAGAMLLEASRGQIVVDRSGRYDVKLAVDKRSEERIIGILRAEFPGHAILSEECGRVGPHSEYLWIVDPLDGTMNFSRRIPLWGVSIALRKGDEDVLGVIYDPNAGEMYTAEKGKGAFLNGAPIHVSARSGIENAMLTFGVSSNALHVARGNDALCSAGVRIGKLRSTGSAVLHLAYTACGRVEGFVEYGLQLWDVAAGVVIVREAGGAASMRSLPDGGVDFAASNGLIHEALLEAIGWNQPR